MEAWHDNMSTSRFYVSRVISFGSTDASYIDEVYFKRVNGTGCLRLQVRKSPGEVDN